MAAAEELPRPGRLPLAGATNETDDVTVDDRDPTMLPRPEQPPTFSDAPLDDAEVMPEPPERRRRRWPRVILALVLLAMIGGAVFAALQLRQPSHAVPDLQGLREDQAVAMARANHWHVVRKTARQDGSDPGTVLFQDPSKGTRLREGKDITLTVSLGNTLVDVPPGLAGLPLADVMVRLQQAGLVLGDQQHARDETVPKDHVIALADGTPAQLPKGSPVGLEVSDGPQPRTVPQIAPTASYDDAAAAVAGVQLQPVRVDQFSDTVPAGQLIGTDPPAGTQVPRDSQVKVLVSKGQELIPIPRVEGMTVGDATAALQAAGFVVDGVIGDPSNRVLFTDPPPGEKHPRGTKVIIYTRR
jgi:serine/threonine-protein kinase